MSPSIDDTGTTLNVSSLSRNVNEEHLKEIFGCYGRIQKVSVAIDKAGIPKGYAYIQFEKRQEAEIAKESLNEGQIDGMKIKVEFILLPSTKNVDKPYYSRYETNQRRISGGPFRRKNSVSPYRYDRNTRNIYPYRPFRRRSASPTNKIRRRSASPTNKIRRSSASPTNKIRRSSASPTNKIRRRSASPTNKIRRSSSSLRRHNSLSPNRILQKRFSSKSLDRVIQRRSSSVNKIIRKNLITHEKLNSKNLVQLVEEKDTKEISNSKEMEIHKASGSQEKSNIRNSSTISLEKIKGKESALLFNKDVEKNSRNKISNEKIIEKRSRKFSLSPEGKYRKSPVSLSKKLLKNKSISSERLNKNATSSPDINKKPFNIENKTNNKLNTIDKSYKKRSISSDKIHKRSSSPNHITKNLRPNHRRSYTPPRRMFHPSHRNTRSRSHQRYPPSRALRRPPSRSFRNTSPTYTKDSKIAESRRIINKQRPHRPIKIASQSSSKSFSSYTSSRSSSSSSSGSQSSSSISRSGSYSSSSKTNSSFSNSV